MSPQINKFSAVLFMALKLSAGKLSETDHETKYETILAEEKQNSPSWNAVVLDYPSKFRKCDILSLSTGFKSWPPFSSNLMHALNKTYAYRAGHNKESYSNRTYTIYSRTNYSNKAYTLYGLP